MESLMKADIFFFYLFRDNGRLGDFSFRPFVLLN